MAGVFALLGLGAWPVFWVCFFFVDVWWCLVFSFFSHAAVSVRPVLFPCWGVRSGSCACVVLAGSTCGWVFALCPGRRVSTIFLPPGVMAHVGPWCGLTCSIHFPCVRFDGLVVLIVLSGTEG